MIVRRLMNESGTGLQESSHFACTTRDAPMQARTATGRALSIQAKNVGLPGERQVLVAARRRLPPRERACRVYEQVPARRE